VWRAGRTAWDIEDDRRFGGFIRVIVVGMMIGAVFAYEAGRTDAAFVFALDHGNRPLPPVLFSH
jgi:hypothetical protein